MQQEWGIRNFKRRVAVEQFMQGYAESSQYAAAKRDQWGNALERYVRECASIQAQIIYPTNDGRVAYEAGILQCGLPLREDGNANNRAVVYINWCRTAGLTRIDVEPAPQILLLISRMKDAGSASASTDSTQEAI